MQQRSRSYRSGYHEAVYETSALEMAMVNSDKGITNLHVPSAMLLSTHPCQPAIRSSGRMWGH